MDFEYFTDKKQNKRAEEEELLELIKETSIGDPISSSSSAFFGGPRLGLSQSAALASIVTKLPNLVEENVKYKITKLGPNWKNFFDTNEPEKFEALKQIIYYLGLPETLDRKEKEITSTTKTTHTTTDSLMWKIQKNRFGLSLPSIDIFSDLATFGKSSYSYYPQDLKYIVTFNPFEPVKETTTLQFYFPVPSAHHLRTIETLLPKVIFKESISESYLPTLKVFATTFYECWIHAYLACLIPTYKLSRSDLQKGFAKQSLLQTLIAPTSRALLLKQISLEIQNYQTIGSKSSGIYSQMKRKGKSGEAKEEKEGTSELPSTFVTKSGQTSPQEKQIEKQKVPQEEKENLLFERGHKLVESIHRLKGISKRE